MRQQRFVSYGRSRPFFVGSANPIIKRKPRRRSAGVSGVGCRNAYGSISHPNIMLLSSCARLWQWATYLPVKLRNLR